MFRPFRVSSNLGRSCVNGDDASFLRLCHSNICELMVDKTRGVPPKENGTGTVCELCRRGWFRCLLGCVECPCCQESAMYIGRGATTLDKVSIIRSVCR